MHAATGEGFSLSILEYMSAGLATLVPDTPTVCQAISDWATGLIYRTGDLNHAVSQLRCLASDPMLRNRLGQQAKAVVDREYHIDRCNRIFVETICYMI
jgi:glycosyltransferase involved in cell wall biosynthesis